jgi:mutator protein MutT
MKLKRTVTAIIIYNNKLLFFKRDNTPSITEPDRWQFPGGHVETGESLNQAVERELIEEVSYIPNKISYLGSIKNRFREVGVFWSYVDYKESKKFKLGDTEGQKIEFMTIEQALNKNLTKNVKFYLSSYKDIINRHLKNKTAPDIEEVKKNTNLAKFFYFKIINR